MSEPLTIADYEVVLADHRALVRRLDVALNGEAGAAKQASLCDIVGQVEDGHWALERRDVLDRLRIALAHIAIASPFYSGGKFEDLSSVLARVKRDARLGLGFDK